MKQLLLVCLCLVLGVGCKSWGTIFKEREMLKLHVENAQRYYHAANYEAAVQQANKALEIDWDDPKARTILGYCYLQVGRYAK
ncbi:MAG: tetratricopeptide repeat protein, partial [Planctomycetota bacterium]